MDVEITGRRERRGRFDQRRRAASLLGSDIHDNPGAALAIRAGASPRVTHNVFARNGLSERTGAALILDPEAQPTFFGNMFRGIAADAFRALGDRAVESVTRDNWFVDATDAQTRSPQQAAARGRRGR